MAAGTQDRATELVRSFAGSSEYRFQTYEALVDLGPAALPALRDGLRSDSWQIRRWSAICLDRVADAETLADLVPLLRDPHAKVRLWAVHALACDHCKTDARCPVDIVPHLIDRAENDDSMRVRRMAVIMLTTDLADSRAIPALERMLAEETDRKLLLHADEGLGRLRQAGLDHDE